MDHEYFYIQVFKSQSRFSVAPIFFFFFFFEKALFLCLEYLKKH